VQQDGKEPIKPKAKAHDQAAVTISGRFRRPPENPAKGY